MELKCSICKDKTDKNVILIVPPDRSACYCLWHLLPSISNPPLTREDALVMTKIVSWLEERGHKIPSAPEMDIGKVLKVTDEPRPKLKKPKYHSN